MRVKFAVLMAAMAVGATALAQPLSGAPASAVPAAAPAPVIPPSLCAKPNLDATFPTLPDPNTVAASQVVKLQRAYNVWGGTVKAYYDCKQKELNQIDAEVDAVKAKSPAVKQATEYQNILAEFEKAAGAQRAAGVPTTISGVKPPAPGAACPAAPALTAAPAAPAPLAPGAKPNKKEIEASSKAFGEWARPYYVYLKCAEPLINSSIKETNAALEPYKLRKSAAAADYNDVAAKAKVYNDKWSEFAKAYNAHLRASAPH